MNRIAVITGGGRGIGRATALAFARRGLDLALYGRVAGDLEAVAEQARAEGVRVLAVECDVSSGAAVDEAAARVLRELGVPHVLVNNAGIVHRAPVEDTTEQAWDHVVAVNLKGPFLVSRSFLAAMREQDAGRIVHVSSISATLGTPKLSAYCASKWGLVGFMKALAEELRGTSVQTMAVLPGSVDTAMLRGSGFAPQMTADDVAATIVWTALDAPAALHGATVPIFGAG
ncbi:MAG: SDR family oxidoreductase [Myxococcales bacterium]|nr:SDR family oxidoreductase [Myxococcales bacterium]MBL8714358.1 SDR family oxidoreductase [Myxococcales bacterium]